MSQLSGH